MTARHLVVALVVLVLVAGGVWLAQRDDCYTPSSPNDDTCLNLSVNCCKR